MKLMAAGRLVALVLCAALAAFAAHAAPTPTFDYCNTTSQVPGVPPLVPYEVSDTSHIVLMEYTMSFGPNAYGPTDGAVPTLANTTSTFSGTPTYDSSDCHILGAHVDSFMSMHVDAVATDLANGMACVFGGATESIGTTLQTAVSVVNACGAQYQTLQQDKAKVAALYQYYAQHNVPLRILPMLGIMNDIDHALDNEYFAQDGTDTGQSPFTRGLAQFKAWADQYPNQVVRYHGKPVLLLYFGINPANMQPAYTKIVNAGMQNAFTYRFLTGFTDSQPSLRSGTGTGIAGLNVLNVPALSPAPAAPYTIWSWVDRLSAAGAQPIYLPGYAVDVPGARPENLVVETAFPGNSPPPAGDCTQQAGTAWLASDARPRDPNNPANVLTDFMAKANILQPKFLFVNGYNELSCPDQGVTEATSNDIEPTGPRGSSSMIWGDKYVNLFTTTLANYKGGLARPADLATRGWVSVAGGGQDYRMISGFVVAGPAPKKVLIRGWGPTLGSYGLSPFIPNPKLTLMSGTTAIATNDDWASAPNAAEISAAGQQPPNAKESAILVTLNPGVYTAILEDAAGNAGLGMIDVYEFDGSSGGSPFSNLSTRGWVAGGPTSATSMIGGLIISGTQPQKVVLTATGPSLAAYGIAPTLANPRLDVYNSAGAVIASNDNWQAGNNGGNDIPAQWRPTNPYEAALALTLAPGSYTVQVSAADGGYGVAVLGVFTY
jgi:hypothetical protein